MKRIYKAYFESDLTEELKKKIGMIIYQVYDPHVLLPEYSVAYTVDGEIYEIKLQIKYWKEMLKFEDIGPGYRNRLYDLEKNGWKKYYSSSIGVFYLVAPKFVERANQIVGKRDPMYASENLEKLFLKGKQATFYSWLTPYEPSQIRERKESRI